MREVEKDGIIYECPEEYLENFLKSGWKLYEKKKVEQKPEIKRGK